jgi:hypothetical protein
MAVILLSATGCANHLTLKRPLSSQASNTVFLQPSKDKTIYVEVRNASDNPHALLSALPSRLSEKGYTVVQDPDLAHFILQATTVFAAKAKPGTTLDSLVAGGFGSMVVGGLGTALALSRNMGFGYIPGGAAAGALVGFVGSKATEDTQLSLVADIQVTERTKDQVEQVVSSQVAQGGGASQSGEIHRAVPRSIPQCPERGNHDGNHSRSTSGEHTPPQSSLCRDGARDVDV